MAKAKGYVVQIKGFLGWYNHASFKHKQRAKDHADSQRRQGAQARIIKKPVNKKFLIF